MWGLFAAAVAIVGCLGCLWVVLHDNVTVRTATGMLRRPITYYAVGAIVVVIVIEAKGVRPPKPYINYNLV